MKHIVRQNSDTVHGVRDARQTMCHWVFISEQSFEGHPVYLGSDTNRPITCRRCRNVMLKEVVYLLKRATAGTLEGLLEALSLGK